MNYKSPLGTSSLTYKNTQNTRSIATNTSELQANNAVEPDSISASTNNQKSNSDLLLFSTDVSSSNQSMEQNNRHANYQKQAYRQWKQNDKDKHLMARQSPGRYNNFPPRHANYYYNTRPNTTDDAKYYSPSMVSDPWQELIRTRLNNVDV